MAQFSQKLQNCAFCKLALVPSHKMKYILHKCKCTVRFFKKICQLDQSKFSWWASNIDHFDGSTTAIVASGARNPAVKGFVLEKMDISKPFNIHLELLRMGHRVTLKVVQGIIYRAKFGRWTNSISDCTRLVQANLYRPEIPDGEPFYFGPQAVSGRSLGSGTPMDPFILGVTS